MKLISWIKDGCWHDWYKLDCMSSYTLVEHICLKCGKYEDTITPYLEEIVAKEEKAKQREILAKKLMDKKKKI